MKLAALTTRELLELEQEHLLHKLKMLPEIYAYDSFSQALYCVYTMDRIIEIEWELRCKRE